MAKKRDVYHVTPNSNGGWDVKKEGGRRPSAHADRKSDAIARGKELAKKVPLGQRMIKPKLWKFIFLMSLTSPKMILKITALLMSR